MKNTRPLSDQHKERLRALIAKHKLAGTAKLFKCSISTLYRGLGGLGLTQGTATLIETGIVARDKEGKNP